MTTTMTICGGEIGRNGILYEYGTSVEIVGPLLRLRLCLRLCRTNKLGYWVNDFVDDFVNMLRPWQLINEIVKTFGKIVEKFKFLTDNAMKLMNLMKLMNTKDVELFKFKFLTRNTNKNKPLPLPVVMVVIFVNTKVNDLVNGFVNVELLKFKFLTRNTNTSKPLPGGGGAP